MKKYMKPKDVAEILSITPKQASTYANEIEEANLHTFTRTPLGSLLFVESEVEMIKDYEEIKSFFERKFDAQEIYREKLLEQGIKEEEPEWLKLLQNAKKQLT